MNLDFEDSTPATAEFIAQNNRTVIGNYKSNHRLIKEHANQEIAAAEGAYGRRQVFELIQNAADAIAGHANGRITVVLTKDALYCANNGAPITVGGLAALLYSFSSPKLDDEIGRYGLGFKSVLGVSDSPEFYGNSVSFCFDQKWAEDLIRNETGYKGAIPKLRVTKPIERNTNEAGDVCLKTLLEWATSVVKLPFRNNKHEWLGDDVNNFPGEFLLFCPDVKELLLEDHSAGSSSIKRHSFSRRGKDPIRVRIAVNDKATDWSVFRATVKPTELAKRDGGYFAGRDSVNISWALPSQGGSTDGQFWAFFPLQKERMSLKGILNGAWKLNDDRQNILDGLFNEELLEASANLALVNLPFVFNKKDPGKLLDVFPARLDERVGADLTLTKRFYELSASFPTVPDNEGNLRPVGELRIPPRGLPEKALKLWADCQYQPSNWAHPSTVLTTTRSARLDQLMSQDQKREDLVAWLEALVSEETAKKAVQEFGCEHEDVLVGGSSQAIRIAAAILKNESVSVETQQEVRRARILLTADGTVVDLDPSRVYLPTGEGQTYEGLLIVHPELLKQNTLSNDFAVLGITEVDANSELQSLIGSGGIRFFPDRYWERLWAIVTRMEQDSSTSGRAAEILRTASESNDPRSFIKVKTVDGQFRLLRMTLLPGSIVSLDESSDRAVAVDMEFHKGHEHVLSSLGAVTVPTEGGGSIDEVWFPEYRDYAFKTFLAAKSAESPQPRFDKLVFEEAQFAGPLEPLYNLDEKGHCRFTTILLTAIEITEKWHYSHVSSSAYPMVEIDSPVLWVIKNEGVFQTSKGPKPLSDVVGSSFEEWSQFFPVVDLTAEIQQLLNIPQTGGELDNDHLAEALENVVEVVSPFMVGAFYAFLTDYCEALDAIWAKKGDEKSWFKPHEVTVVVATSISDPVISIIKELGKPFIIVEDAVNARKLVEKWHLTPVESSIVFETRAVESGQETPLIDYFVGLGHHLESDKLGLNIVPCSALRREVFTNGGVRSESKNYIYEKDRFYYLDSLSNTDLLDYVDEALELELSAYEIEDILSYQRSEEKQNVVRRIRETQSLSEKLAISVGTESLKKWLSKSLLDVVEARNGNPNDKAVAELFLSVYGVESLIRLKEDLALAGFDVPSQWAGSYKARRFVKELGFGSEFAGFESSDRKAAIDVPGPSTLPPLHPFQDKAAQRIKSLLLSGGVNRRGLLSLPTGAGKTRVAVEAVIRTIRDDNIPGPILWVAQSDELCEQAVQSWNEVWSSVGSRFPLRLNRLWASNEADEWNSGPQVVIATMQKLQNVIDNPDYDWLKECTALIIDEAHLSTTPAYTAILKWLGTAKSSSRCPVLGLTATPFRGGEEETNRLAARYDHYRLDDGILGPEPYKTLQSMGVLAEVKHEILKGVDIHLDERELRELKERRRLPSTANDRLGNNRARNREIIDAVKGMPDDWPVLLFAVSVENAKIIAAMLTAEGIVSAAISAETEAGARRFYIEKFRNREIRVLTNYGVLTTGFDAPAVRAIIVARPTFSPGVYQQMIGRGLRGPLNGGKVECLIVNVKDNFEKFGETLAFTEFEFLWNKE